MEETLAPLNWSKRSGWVATATNSRVVAAGIQVLREACCVVRLVEDLRLVYLRERLEVKLGDLMVMELLLDLRV